MRKKKIELIDIAYPLFLIMVAFVVGIIGYFSGETLAYNQNATEVTKTHLEEYQNGYVYCPYCGEKLEEVTE